MRTASLRGLVVCLLWLPGAVRAAGPVLTPDTTDRVRQALDGIRDTVRYESISVDRDHLIARLCSTNAAPNRCFTIRLDPPEPRCAADSNAAFCVSFPAEPPDPIARDIVLRQLETRFPARAWGGAADDRARTLNVPLVAGLAFLPLVLGLGFGALLRRKRSGVLLIVSEAGLPAFAASVLNAVHPTVGLWDVLLAAALFSAGLLFGHHANFLRWRRGLLAAGVFSIGLLLLEFGTRSALPHVPDFTLDSILLSEATPEQAPADATCEVTYGHWPGSMKRLNRMVESPANRAPGDSAKHRVLHLGDSMVFGVGVEESETFVALLGAAQPEVDHVNGGIPATAPDEYLAALQGWMKQLRFDRVVLYLFAGNDLDLDAPSPCCEWQSILRYEDGKAALRCPEARSQTSPIGRIRWLRQHSHPPYLLKAMARRSQLLAYVTMVLFSDRSTTTSDQATRYQHLDAVLRTAKALCQAQGVALTVVVLPDRAALEGRTKVTQEIAQRMAAASRSAGIDTLDATELLAARHDGPGVFLNEIPNDFHLSIAGHRVIADWLRTQLPPSPKAAEAR